MMVLGLSIFVFLNIIAVGADYAHNPFLSNGKSPKFYYNVLVKSIIIFWPSPILFLFNTREHLAEKYFPDIEKLC